MAENEVEVNLNALCEDIENFRQLCSRWMTKLRMYLMQSVNLAECGKDRKRRISAADRK